MKSANIGVIGCGQRIQCVISQLKKQAGDKVEITAVCDPKDEAVRQTREKFSPDAKVYADYNALLNHPGLEWVFVGSLNCQHREHVQAAFEKGLNVFCEKPLATTLEDCLAMKKAWRESGQKFSIGFTLRYSPFYRKVKELVKDGAIGRIISMEFNETLHFDHGGFIHSDWRRRSDLAGSHLLEKCCHDMDIVHWITESVPVRAASFGGLNFFTPENRGLVKKIGKGPKGWDAFSGWGRPTEAEPFSDDKDILDNQVAILEFANSIRSTFHTNASTNLPERRLYLCGSEGTMRADVIKGKIELAPKSYGKEPVLIDPGASGGHGGGDSILGKSLADSILNGAEPITSLEDGLKAGITCFGIDQAWRTGTVADLTPMWKKAGVNISSKAPAAKQRA